MEIINGLVSIVEAVGFPIVAALGLGWFVNKAWADIQTNNREQIEDLIKLNKEREDRMLSQIDTFNTTLQDFNSTLTKIDSKIENLEKTIASK